MKIQIALFVLTFFCLRAVAQDNLKIMHPSNVFNPDLSIRKEKALDKRDYLMEKPTLSNQEQQELDSLLNLYDESVENIWDIIGGGCSWYCGGGNYKVIASSFLIEDEARYPAIRANDNSYKTAWVVDKNGGVGEYIEYYFKNQSPRVTEIIITNGFVKNESVWKKNNRVKKIKLYINGVGYAILNLEDSRTDQTFRFKPIGKNKNGSDLILRFEILDVYKGDSFNHSAISEIYFDGIDVH